MQSDKNNNLKALDPRTKLIILISLSTAAMLTKSIYYLIILNAIALLTLFIGGINIKRIFQSIKPMLVVIISLFIIQCLFYRSGEPLLVIKNFTLVTTGGINMAGLISLRLVLIILSAQVVLAGEINDYLLALVKCKVPYEIAFMVITGISFLPILKEEAFNIFYSMQLRGTEFKKTNLKNKIKLYTKLAIPILANSIIRSKEIAIAMETRGLRAYPQRSYYHTLKMAKKDYIISLLYPALIIFLAIGMPQILSKIII